MTKTVNKDFISDNLDRYEDTQGILPERLEEYGEMYKDQGHLTQDQLYEIAYESSTRSAHYVNQNPKERCRRVTENVRKVSGDFSEIRLLTGLKGFKAATASCVLTCLAPSRHAVVDTRVWASLERLGYYDERKESFTPKHYLKMIGTIRDISENTGYRTSDIGYALFAYDDHVREGTLH